MVRLGHYQLLNEGFQPSQAPADKLPRIFMTESGQALWKTTTGELFGDFLRILHGIDIKHVPLQISYLCCLADVADKYESLSALAIYAREGDIIGRLGMMDTVEYPKRISEERLRQMILAGWVFNEDNFFEVGTKQLINEGSTLWIGTDNSPDGEVGLWWRLPDGLESIAPSSKHTIMTDVPA